MKQLKKVNIDSEDVEKCVRKSFITDSDGKIVDNRLLKEDRKWSAQLGVFMHPSLTINNITYRGDLNGYDIFRAVCAGFSDQPSVCKGDNIFSALSQLEDSSSSNK